MKLISSVQFILKFFLAIMILITMKYMSRDVQRGFICGDPSLSLNLKPDTITNLTLVAWAVSPLLILLICETIFNFKDFDSVQVCLKRSWRNTTYLCHRYFINLVLKHILVAAAKLFTGGHRPHFFETCKPDKMFNCTLGTFVQDYQCTNLDVPKWKIYDASMSFFSGHASTCVFSCFFICWYLQKRLKCESLFLLPFVQASLVCLSYYGSISRVFDHRHHWWDVLTGALVGLFTTYHTCYVLCKDRYSKPEQPQLPTEINTFLSAENKSTNNQ